MRIFHIDAEQCTELSAPSEVLPATGDPLPSHLDDTSWNDLLEFRRLAAAPGTEILYADKGHSLPGPEPSAFLWRKRHFGTTR